MRFGYTRVSTVAQTLHQQHDALKAAGASKIYSDTMSGARDDRPGLAALMVAEINGIGASTGVCPTPTRAIYTTPWGATRPRTPSHHSAARPGGVSAPVPETRLMSYEYFAGAELVAERYLAPRAR
jgi:hypothetical protein